MKTVKYSIDLALFFLLIFLFTVPRIWLTGVCETLSEQVQLASAAIRAEEDHTPYVVELERIFERTAPTMRLFMDHTSVDALGTAIGVCAPYDQTNDLLSSLNAVSAAVTHLKNIEAFAWDCIF